MEGLGNLAALLSPVFTSKNHPKNKCLGFKKIFKNCKKNKITKFLPLWGINIKNVKSLIETDIIGYAFQRGE
ncbi:MAG: hypothetical protein CM1200mP13_16020 [Candidatus Pelagibacterales bacterium]|nr:MAG: hypothetical protein CM1200mP13_16020 [Pelagibacterales bacterium]